MKLWKLEGGVQARLDMQNFEEAKAGHVGEGIYMCKLTPFQGASKLHSTMTMELPWFYIEGIETFREYVVTLGHFHLHKYRMTSTHRGCRFHAKALLELEIDAFMNHLGHHKREVGLKTTSLGTQPHYYKVARRLVRKRTRSAQHGTLLATLISKEKTMKLPKKKRSSFTTYQVAKR